MMVLRSPLFRGLTAGNGLLLALHLRCISGFSGTLLQRHRPFYSRDNNRGRDRARPLCTGAGVHVESALCGSADPSFLAPFSISLAESIIFAEARLAEAGDPEASAVAPYLVAHAVGERGSKSVPSLRRRLDFDEFNPAKAEPLGCEVAERLSALLARRATREPLQYILGEVRLRATFTYFAIFLLINKTHTPLLADS